MTEVSGSPLLSVDRPRSTRSSISSDAARRKMSARPRQPPLDPTAWSSWLHSYQRGLWTDSSGVDSDTEAPCSPLGDAGASTSSCTSVSGSTDDRPKMCPLQDQMVRSHNGNMLDSFEFFKRNGWLAPPQLPRKHRHKCGLALRRHHVTGPHEREALNLYVKHTMAVFKVDYASFMIASTNESDMLILAQEGGKADVQRIDRATTLCAHAMLLSEDEVLVVADTSKDWRFSACPATNAGTPCSKLGHSLRFYASAPLYLSYSYDGVEGMVQAGRLCIMAREPRQFSEADADLLLSISRMASDAMEKEHQIRRNAKTADMQRRSAKLVRAIETVKSSSVSRSPASTDAGGGDDDAAASSSAESSGAEGMLRYSTSVIDIACDELRGALGAVAVAAIDISGLRIKPAAQGSVSPRTSAYPMTPWQVPDTRLLAAPLTPPSELGGATTAILDAVAGPSTSPTMRRHPMHRTRSSGVDEVEPMVNGPPVQLLCLGGDAKYRPVVKGPAQLQALCDWLGRRVRNDRLESRVKVYRTPHDTTQSDEDSEPLDAPPPSSSNPLSPLLPGEVPVREYAVAAAYDVQQARPLLCFLVMFSDDAALEEPEQLFMESCVEYAVSSIIRQKARDIDGIQAEFLRHVQHNLRTPLHGALGAVEYLRSFIIAGDITEEEAAPSIDLRPDGVLATLLDSISLSGTTLNTYIDDLLSFQNLAGLTDGSRRLAKPVSTDIVKLVETVCNEEWELAQRLEMQSQRLEVGSGGSNTSLQLIIKADDRVAAHEWMVDAKALSHAVRKVASNAIKFSHHGYVEVCLRAGRHAPDAETGEVPVEIEVRDTGIGMTREFCTEHLTKPFTKGDSFRDGIGLGMTIVSSTVQNMGGKLSVASEVNVGTRVTMTLPLAVGNPRAGNGGVADGGAATSPQPFAVKRIAFFGMETRGLRRLSNSICEYLMPNGDLQLVSDPLEADCIILPDCAISRLVEGDSPLRDRLRPDARFVVVQLSLRVRPEGIVAFQDRAVLPFLSPHGPSALDLLVRFLREEHPGMIRDAAHRPLHAYYHPRSASVDGPSDATRVNGSDASAVSDADSASTVVAVEASLKGAVEPSTDPDAAPAGDDGEAHVAAVQSEPSSAPPEQPTPIDEGRVEGGGHDSGDEFRVLVVEDNPINMKLIVTLLKRLQIRYEEAHDGAEAVLKFISFRPAVVLLDISLPIQDGFEACTQMRAHNHPSHIVAITALSSDDDRQRGIETCGMDAWMTKPVSPRLLRQDIIAWQQAWLDKAIAVADPASRPAEPEPVAA
ncbi:uncharacterized protein PFL1_04305 [Pseudozyma flocculosa PF-1]|uniref:histidine kinase n=2 Tax=Pseudozyma flocculosa TaxID=84751 RepID=A0A5C3FB85_9BASI|nr:uncharacterized protein PFL1_04305 [Pseudozyma flocculosa PF-1]EPQ27978.1 hypothetical protein PFL1_04305 [Pseudozyma flocculosa PF-1]SPO41632.1 related to SLN1 - histidine kinase osmosensor that regulates a MAP kinase cascade [Pseudozyma flocculosa]